VAAQRAGFPQLTSFALEHIIIKWTRTYSGELLILKTRQGEGAMTQKVELLVGSHSDWLRLVRVKTRVIGFEQAHGHHNLWLAVKIHQGINIQKAHVDSFLRDVCLSLSPRLSRSSPPSRQLARGGASWPRISVELLESRGKLSCHSEWDRMHCTCPI